MAADDSSDTDTASCGFLTSQGRKRALPPCPVRAAGGGADIDPVTGRQDIRHNTSRSGIDIEPTVRSDRVALGIQHRHGADAPKSIPGHPVPCLRVLVTGSLRRCVDRASNECSCIILTTPCYVNTHPGDAGGARTYRERHIRSGDPLSIRVSVWGWSSPTTPATSWGPSSTRRSRRRNRKGEAVTTASPSVPAAVSDAPVTRWRRPPRRSAPWRRGPPGRPARDRHR